MQLKSSAFENNGRIPAKYTCDGSPPAGGMRPALEILDVPKGTVSLAFIMDDPDAPAGTWTHWTMWNIHPATAKISEEEHPKGAIQGVTSFGKPGYGGPCPPSGEHRYVFKLYALDDAVSLAPDAEKSVLESRMKGHIIEQVELTGLYSRG
jgi:Raf kinase inhibitor-like YbhB/YbcL family protein